MADKLISNWMRTKIVPCCDHESRIHKANHTKKATAGFLKVDATCFLHIKLKNGNLGDKKLKPF